MRRTDCNEVASMEKFGRWHWWSLSCSSPVHTAERNYNPQSELSSARLTFKTFASRIWRLTLWSCMSRAPHSRVDLYQRWGKFAAFFFTLKNLGDHYINLQREKPQFLQIFNNCFGEPSCFEWGYLSATTMKISPEGCDAVVFCRCLSVYSFSIKQKAFPTILKHGSCKFLPNVGTCLTN
jgi:hypothetical protein